MYFLNLVISNIMISYLFLTHKILERVYVDHVDISFQVYVHIKVAIVLPGLKNCISISRNLMLKTYILLSIEKASASAYVGTSIV